MGTGISTIHTETFALTGSYAEGDYITLTLTDQITMAADMGWFIKFQQGDYTALTYFQMAQLSSNVPAAIADGYQYQSKKYRQFVYRQSPGVLRGWNTGSGTGYDGSAGPGLADGNSP